MRPVWLLVLWLIAGLCVACGDSGHRDRAAAAPPTPFAPAVTTVPAGYREVLCPFWRGAARGLTVRLDVPMKTKYGEMSGAGCSFTSGTVTGVSVTAAGRSLASWRRKELDPYDGIGGDDEVRHISYRAKTPGFGGRSAERLTWWAYDDGMPFWQTAVQAAGVNLGWSTRRDETVGLETVRRSLGVRRGVRALCPFWGAETRLSFTPPAEHETVQREGGRCQIYFDGSPTVLQSASIDPAPAPLVSLANRVRRSRQASHVRLERGVARIAGRPADRLTWTVTRTKETKHYEPAGTWRIVVTQSALARVRWGQTPRWWQAHRSEYDALVSSIRPN